MCTICWNKICFNNIAFSSALHHALRCVVPKLFATASRREAWCCLLQAGCLGLGLWLQTHWSTHTLINHVLPKAFTDASNLCKPQFRLKHWGYIPGAGLHILGMDCSSMAAFPSHFALTKIHGWVGMWRGASASVNMCVRGAPNGPHIQGGDTGTGTENLRLWEKSEVPTLFFVWNCIFATLIRLNCTASH